MKKFISMGIVLMLAGQTFSQKVSFCEALPLLEGHAVAEFAEIRSGLDKTQTFPTTYFSSIEIREALSSRVTQSMNSYTFTADFGVFSTQDEARKKVKELGSALTACFPGIRLSVSTEKLFKTEYHTLSFHNQDAFRLYDASLKIFPTGGKYYLSFDFEASEKESAFNSNPSSAYTDYQLIKRAADQSSVSVGIRKVIEEAKTGFKSIKTTEIESPEYFSRFGVSYKIAGYDCYIEDRTLDILYYVIPKIKEGNEAVFNQSFAEATQLIESALGPDYGYASSSDGRSIVYVNKYQPEKKAVTLLLTVHDQLFELGLMIHNLQ